MLEELLDRPIAYHRIFVPIAGVAGAIMLSQALYWSKRTTNADGWFWKTREEWEDETGLGRSSQELARQKLVESGVMEERLWGVPAKLHFRVNFKTLSSLLESDQPVGGKAANLIAGKQPTNTETTTDINIIEKINNSSSTSLLGENNKLTKGSLFSIVPLTDL